ncbi:MAG: hypothetical protein OEU91_09385 [Gammaproteobacteria bacterium]|nr:hypothetical protein [Gammaproteobacteria bacterium]
MKTGKLSALLLVLLLAPAALWAAEEQSRIGTVTDTITAGQYIYLKLDEQGEETWLATLRLPVSAGDEVEYLGGDVMQEFYSKGLDRTFASIRFVTRIRVLDQDDVSTGQAMPADKYHQNIARGKTAVVAPEKGDITRAEGGKTIEELFAAGEKLTGETVVLRAVVMKVSNNVLGKNWITLQDGTGAAPDDKLTVTASETVPVGAKVVVDGIVRTNVDLGSGYQYKVLLDNAVFTH